MALSEIEVYLSRFATSSEAIEFETQVLSSTLPKYLPPCARRVLSDNATKPTAEYWTWLTKEFDAMAEIELRRMEVG